MDYVACGHLVQGGRCVQVAAGEPHGVAAGGARAAMPLAMSRAADWRSGAVWAG